MTDRPEQRPEGGLIAAAQKRRRLSNREAAERVPMSEGHWRAIVSGSRSMGGGLWVPVRAPAETLARMAQVVGVTPEQLEEADRADAAMELRELPLPATPEREPTAREIADRMTELANWIKADRERERRETEARIRNLEEEVERLRRQQSG